MKMPRHILGLRRRHLFNIYLLVGSVSIVVAVTVFTIRVGQSVERQSRLTTELFSGLASRLLLSGNTGDVQEVIKFINEIEVPFVITDNAGRPFLWNEPVIGIPMPGYKQLLLEDPTAPSNPDIIAILTLAARFDDGQEPFAIVTPDGERLGTLHYGKSALSQRVRWMPFLELMLMALFFLLIVCRPSVTPSSRHSLLAWRRRPPTSSARP